jgi:4-hydroxy-tetrahydrodipicolinate synthase
MKPAGVYTALVTPFKNGQVDEASLLRLVQQQMKAGVHQFVVNGTTAESPTLSEEESLGILKLVTKAAGPSATIMFGSGSNNTKKTVEFSQKAVAAGAKSLLVVVPYYNKPSQEGMYQHFKAIQEAVDLPTILYNVPGRTVADMSHDTVLRLAQIPGIIGIKDATGDIGRGAMLIRDVPAHFQILSGDDATAAALILLGGRGNISVTANVAPRQMSDLCKAALTGDVKKVRQLNNLLGPLNKLLFVEGNPIPVKWALTQMGRIPSGIRLPLVELGAQFHAPLRAAMVEAGLL